MHNKEHRLFTTTAGGEDAANGTHSTARGWVDRASPAAVGAWGRATDDSSRDSLQRPEGHRLLRFSPPPYRGFAPLLVSLRLRTHTLDSSLPELSTPISTPISAALLLVAAAEHARRQPSPPETFSEHARRRAHRNPTPAPSPSPDARARPCLESRPRPTPDAEPNLRCQVLESHPHHMLSSVPPLPPPTQPLQGLSSHDDYSDDGAIRGTCLHCLHCLRSVRSP
ncbi:hypothetical protein SORBI_3008G047150 [Sorghum bicolor]|uniref:Uncharacterized protein n=1 Tax=Sorghum bicolor TaxID=4558 RepID=A0A1Z5R4S8_SORBI|nr:hypothetical protein SORBI_3008G047150 [Sorghum bicolor]